VLPSAATVTPVRRPLAASRRGVLASLWTLSVAAGVALGFFAGGRGAESPLLREALNDHLRVLYAQSPVEIPNGGLHQVKPWFTGRVDFAPDISFAGDEAFPLEGGAVGYFLDRKTASFVFKRRLHTITLHVFRAEGFAWPRAQAELVAGTRVQVAREAGFNLVLWQASGLGHVLVSDVSRAELLSLTAKLLQ
jgi:anti-sigma factor RsiW